MYIKQSNIPVVLFAQLHSLGKRKVPDLDARIKHCPNILEAASVAIEVIPNFENKTTDLIILKDRFGLTGQKVVCGFDKGRYVVCDDAFKNRIQQQKLSKLQDSVALQRLTNKVEEEADGE
jgi:predicted DNA-binding WGR domain protein